MESALPTPRPAQVPAVPLLQLTLQYQPQHRGEVKQHWNVTFAHQKKISVYGKRILALVIDQIREDDYQLQPFYQLPISSITEGSELTPDTVYAKVKGALYELADVKWSFESITGGEWYIRHLLDTTKEQRVGYKDGVITVLLNPQLAPYLVKAAHFSRFPLGDYLNLQSWYSMRFYEILSAWNDTGYWEVDIDDYRQLMDCWHELDKRGQVKRDGNGQPRMKYHTTTMLIERTMQEPLRELAGTDFEFTFTPLYEEQRTGRGRRKIIRFRFELKKPPMPKTVPQGWADHPATGQLIKRLRDWKVTEANIIKYAPVLRQEGVRALLSAWEQKDGSQRRIDDKVRYCNAALVRMGKQLLEEAAQARRKEEVEARLVAQQVLKL